MPNNNARRGAQRERQLKAAYEARGWRVVRAAGSKGAADLVCGKAGYMTQAVQLKSGRSQWPSPRERAALDEFARAAGWLPIIVWWPPDRQGPRYLPREVWPDGSA